MSTGISHERRVEVGQLLLGARIRLVRESARITLSSLADTSELSVTYLSNIEHGHRLISLDALLRIADALGTTVSALLEGVYPWSHGEEPATPLEAVVDGRRT